MSDTFQPVASPQASERRFHPRQQVLYSQIQLEDDNGGIVLNISERGLAISAVRSLTEDPLQMRFQLSQSKVWIEARGRIAWTNTSKQTAGVEFVGLPYEGRILIRRWLSSADHLSANAEKMPPVEEIAPQAKLASATLEPASTVSTPEPETAAEVIENSAGLPPIVEDAGDIEAVSRYFRASEYLVATDPAEITPNASETQDIEKVPDDSRATSAMPAAANTTGLDSPPPLYLSYEEVKQIRAQFDREPTSTPRNSRQFMGVLLLVVLLVAFFFLGLYFRRAATNKRSAEAPATASQPALPSSSSVIPKSPPISAAVKQPLNRPDFVLQVGAMTRKENADALAETLRKKYFPAFVSHQGSDGFYRVIVGPFSGVDSTLRAKADLKEQGFESIRTPWNSLAEQPSHSAGSH